MSALLAIYQLTTFICVHPQYCRSEITGDMTTRDLRSVPLILQLYQMLLLKSLHIIPLNQQPELQCDSEAATRVTDGSD